MSSYRYLAIALVCYPSHAFFWFTVSDLVYIFITSPKCAPQIVDCHQPERPETGGARHFWPQRTPLWPNGRKKSVAAVPCSCRIRFIWGNHPKRTALGRNARSTTNAKQREGHRVVHWHFCDDTHRGEQWFGNARAALVISATLCEDVTVYISTGSEVVVSERLFTTVFSAAGCATLQPPPRCTGCVIWSNLFHIRKGVSVFFGINAALDVRSWR